MRERARATPKILEPKSYHSPYKSKKSNSSSSKSATIPIDSIMYIQRTIGNQAVQRLLQGSGVSGHGVGKRIQTKLKIGEPNDKYEQEADRVAAQIMRMGESKEYNTLGMKMQDGNIGQKVSNINEKAEVRSSKSGVRREDGYIQRMCPEYEEEEMVQVKNDSTQTTEVTSDMESQIQSKKGGGQPLSGFAQEFFGERIGADCSGVRVHTDTGADKLNRELNAKAFTTGQDIFFQQGEYNPESSKGKELVGHELAHVVQQSHERKTIQRQGEAAENTDSGGDSKLSADPDPLNVSIEFPSSMTIRVNGVMFTNPTFLIKGPNGSILDIAPYTGRGIVDFPLAALESLGIPILSYYHFHYGRARQYLGHHFENAYALSGGTSFIRNALHYGYITADDVTLFGAPSSYNFEHYAGIPHLNIVANPMDIGTMINVSYFNSPLTERQNNPTVMFSINVPFNQNPFEAVTNLGGAISHALSGDLYNLPDVTHNYPRFRN